jgi:Ca-activated chloride channel family protein
MVVLQVSVTEQGRRYVSDLRAEDFTVFEDGKPQPLAFFSRLRTPVALSLLLDTSTSMDSMLGLAQNAAVAFAKRLGPEDVAQVIAFNSGVSILHPFTASLPELEGAIRRTRAGGSTSLYTAVYVALNELRTLRANHSGGIRRHAIVLLSDGEDTSSLVSFDQVLELAQRLDVAIYAIGLSLSPEDRAGARFDEGRFVLRQLAQATGGRVFFAERPEELSQVYGQVAEELSNQYTLAYVPTRAARDGRWRTLTVRVARPECVAATRPGYFAAR